MVAVLLVAMISRYLQLIPVVTGLLAARYLETAPNPPTGSITYDPDTRNPLEAFPANDHFRSLRVRAEPQSACHRRRCRHPGALPSASG
uniref:Putative secreted peptide n=1 Tax=Anopheles braziliensis TaxID=58242 RepID=A0A2M3ZRB0_9DIPT